MRKRESNGSKLFLLELMIAIFFFMVMAAICVQLFAEAHAMSVRSKELVQSVNAAANVAEYYSVWDLREESWQKAFPEGTWQEESWELRYNSAWQPCSEDGRYLLQMELVEAEELRTAQIRVVEAVTERTIYELDVKRMR